MAYPETHGFKQSPSYEELEARVSRLERHLGLAPIADAQSGPQPEKTAYIPSQPSKYEEGSQLELSIGEFGLAWLGSFIFFLGIVFLITYTFSLGYRLLATVLGYLSAAGLFFIASFWRMRASHLSRLLATGSLLLLYYTTMRLYFFSPSPLLNNSYIVAFLLLAVVALQLYFARHRNSQWMASVAILLAMMAALLIDQTHISLPIVVAACAVALYLAIRHEWWRMLIASIVFAYTAHLLWLLSNPLVGHSLQGVSGHQYNLVYLFLYAAIFCLPLILNKEVLADNNTSMAIVFFNSAGLSLLAFLVALTHFQQDYAAVSLGVCGLFLIFSIIQWVKTEQQLAPALYACFGFLAMSIAIYGYAAIPASFFWLSLQSLLVVSMALWFRSKILVVVNSFIYVGMLLGYFVVSPSSHPVNFSFALVALASARVMNWQKERLTLRTEMLRNVYLLIAFILIFYALRSAVPGQYVTLSWTITAVGYFLLSYLLKSIKYRLMAISAIMVTIVYLFLVDLAQLDPRFRVAAFLFLGFMAVVISLYYTRIRKPRDKGEV